MTTTNSPPAEPIVCSWAWWREHGRQILASGPVTRVHLTAPPAHVPAGCSAVFRFDDWPGVEFVYSPVRPPT